MTPGSLADSCAFGTKGPHLAHGPHPLERMSSSTDYFSGGRAHRCENVGRFDAPRHAALTHPAPPHSPVLSGDSRYFFAFSSK